jgi:hypothetical protein
MTTKAARFYEDKYIGHLTDEQKRQRQARCLVHNPQDFADVVIRHAHRLVRDGRGEYQFARVESEGVTLWVLEESTATYRD